MTQLTLTVAPNSIFLEGNANSFTQDSYPDGVYRADGWWGPTAEGKAHDYNGNIYTVIWMGAHWEDGGELQVEPGWNNPVIVAKDQVGLSYGQGNLLNDPTIKILLSWEVKK